MQVSRKWLALLLCVVILALLGYYTYDQREYLAESPLNQSNQIQNLSYSITDHDNNTYVIDQSLKRVMKIDPTGTLRFAIDVDQRDSDGFYLTTDLAVDQDENIYTLSIRLDGLGIRIESEEIVKYNRSGQFVEQIYVLDYPVDERPTRPGKLRDLSIQDNVLSFYHVLGQDLSLRQIDLDSHSIMEVMEVTLDDDMYLFHLSGTEPGNIFFTTRRGQIFQISEEDEFNLIYSGQDVVDDDLISYPVSIAATADGDVYYADLSLAEIRKISNAGQANGLEHSARTILTEERLMNANFDISLKSVGSLNEHLGNVDLAAGGKVIKLNSTGQIEGVLEEATYTWQQFAQKVSVWLAMIFILLILAYLARLIYVSFMHRKVSLILKQMAVFIPLVILSMVIVAGIVYQGFSEQFEDEVFDKLKMLVHVSSPTLDVERIERIRHPGHYRNEDFQVVFEQNQSFLRGGPDIDDDALYSVLYKLEDNQVFVLMNYNTSVGTYYPLQMRNIYEQVMSNGRITTTTDPDVDGVWMYAIGPVYNSEGDMIGLHEVGMTSRNFDQSRSELFWRTAQYISVITPIIIVVLLLMTYYFLSHIRRLRNSVNKIASGHWGTRVSITTRDEVEDLGQSFNVMAQHIQDYISKVNMLNNAYYRFVPQQFLRFLGKESITDVQLGDQVEQEISILVCNVRSFYEMSSNMKPEENFNFINTFLKNAGPVIRENHGLINKYLGAGILALYPQKPEQAIQSSVDMLHMLRAFNDQRKQNQEKTIEIGIGIHKGPLMIGIVGEEQRLEGAVISDHVNLASRLEQMTETFGSSILVSAQTFESVQNQQQFEHRKLGMLQLNENSAPVVIYDLFEADEESIKQKKRLCKKQFEQAVMFYQEGRFYDARTAFVHIIKQNPDDKIAKIYFHLCDEFYQTGAPSGWNGTLRT